MRGLAEIAAYNDAFIEHRAQYRRQKRLAEAAGRRLLNRHKPVERGSRPGQRAVRLALVTAYASA